jgi:hypothetical protein
MGASSILPASSIQCGHTSFKNVKIDHLDPPCGKVVFLQQADCQELKKIPFALIQNDPYTPRLSTALQQPTQQTEQPDPPPSPDAGHDN